MSQVNKVAIAIGVVVTAIILFIAGVFFFLFSSTSQDVEAANQFFQTLSTDTEAAYELSADLFKEYSTLEDFEALLLDVPELKMVEEAKFPTRSTTTNDGLKVTALLGTIHLTDGEEMLIEVLMVDQEENGEQVPHVAGFDINQEYVQTRIKDIESSFTETDPL